MKILFRLIKAALLLTGCLLNIQAAEAASGQDKELNTEAAFALIQRVLPKYAKHFEILYISAENGKDIFELESRNGKVVLKGNNGISVASAFNYWLKNYAHCDVSWNGTNLNIPNPFPLVKQKIHKVTPHEYRHYFNYCTFNYTASWWDWERWQWEIDFMAMNGINMPLAMTGQEALWDRVYRSMGFTNKDMDAFFTGPAYFMWFWAGNIDALNGPLPKSWMTSHELLQKKILARERELGMKPILPAFSGHVPPSFKKRFPNAKVDTVNWEGRFADAYVLHPDDPLFQEIGDRFMKEQTKVFGTDHLYGADTFNEMYLPREDADYVRKIGSAVYKAMAKFDPKAVWVMQGWLFWDKRDFWKPDRIKNYLSEVPVENLIVLDLFSEEQPVWNKTEAYFGKQWIWCMLHNFGGKNSLFGNLSDIAKVPSQVLHDSNKGKLTGIGVVPEGVEQNPVVYALMLENVWNDKPIELDNWIKDYTVRRYGKKNLFAEKAWSILNKTVYAHEGGYDPIIVNRPTFGKKSFFVNLNIEYKPIELLAAWSNLISATPQFKANDCFQFDLVTVGRQVLANYSTVLQKQFAKDFEDKNVAEFEKHSKEFIELIEDMDKLMGTRREFLLGKWLNDAKRWGTNAEEKKLYEMNARDLITLWGGKDAVLHEYASKQWSGLFNGFYKQRWAQFIADARESLKNGNKFDQDLFDEKIKKWEWNWVNGSEQYPERPSGDPALVSKMIYAKYVVKVAAAYNVAKK